MKRFALALALLLAPSAAFAQCNGVFPNNTVCGNVTGSGNLPRPTTPSAFQGSAGGTNGQVQFNNNGALSGFSVGGDASLTPITGILTLTPSGITPGSYGGTNSIPIITFDAKGRATAATVTPISVTPVATTLALKTPLDYGAACDGVANDSGALQAWLDGISNFAAVGWGLSGRTCMFGNYTPFAARGVMCARDRTMIYGNNMTLKLLTNAAGYGNAGMTTCGTATPDQVHGITSFAMRDMIIDGNRDNQLTQVQGSAALLYIIASRFVDLDHNSTINSMADGLYVGGDSSLANVTTFWSVRNHRSENNWRQGFSIVGADRGNVIGGDFNNTTNAHFDGPMCGIDLEPNGATTANSNIWISGVRAAGNGRAGMTTSGASGICFFGSNQTNIVITDSTSTGNFHYAYQTYTPIGTNELRIHSIVGAGNLSGTSANSAVDWFPSSVSTGAANSCGAGFRCMGIPN